MTFLLVAFRKFRENKSNCIKMASTALTESMNLSSIGQEVAIFSKSLVICVLLCFFGFFFWCVYNVFLLKRFLLNHSISVFVHYNRDFDTMRSLFFNFCCGELKLKERNASKTFAERELDMDHRE